MDQTILLYITIFTITFILTKYLLRKLQNLPPTPFPTVPVLGHLHLITNPNTIHRTLATLSKSHGPVIHLQFGSRPVLLISSTSAALDCLHYNDTTFANRPQLISGRILGYNYTDMIWAPYGSLWRNHRKIASTEILSPHRLRLLQQIRADEVRFFVKRVHETFLQGGNVEVKPAFFELTNNVMMRMIAGKRCYKYGETVDDNEGETFRVLTMELFDTGPPFIMADFFPVMKYFGKGSIEKSYEGLFARYDVFFQGLVDEKRREMAEEKVEEGIGKESKSKSLIEVLLDLHKTDPGYFTDNVIKGLVQDLLFGGSETTSTTMEWALSLLLNHPQTLKKAQKEIDEWVGNDRLLSETDIPHLPFLRCIINETLRMYPAAALLPPHENSKSCTVGGYHIKEKTMLMVNIWAIHNDPSYWDEPSKFKPERFESLKGGKLECVFMPFGSGRRACPGENLAVHVVGLALGTLLHCFDWEQVGDELVDMEESVGVTMSKAKPLEAKCKPRSCMTKLISCI